MTKEDSLSKVGKENGWFEDLGIVLNKYFFISLFGITDFQEQLQQRNNIMLTIMINYCYHPLVGFYL